MEDLQIEMIISPQIICRLNGSPISVKKFKREMFRRKYRKKFKLKNIEYSEDKDFITNTQMLCTMFVSYND